MENNNPLDGLMRSTLDRVCEMADANTIIGKPMETADGVTLIPISKVSIGFGSGGSYGKTDQEKFTGGSGAGIRIDPVAFLIVRDGMTRILPVAMAPRSTADRIVDMAPDMISKVENYFDRRKADNDENGET